MEKLIKEWIEEELENRDNAMLVFDLDWIIRYYYTDDKGWVKLCGFSKETEEYILNIPKESLSTLIDVIRQNVLKRMRK